MTVESENASEEINELVEKCINCGMCRGRCPVFKALREEVSSPRGKTLLLNQQFYDKLMFSCTLCKACELNCPLGLKLCDAFRKSRIVLNGKKQELPGNKEMMKTIRKFGNPFGDSTDNKKLYCC